MNRLKYVFVNQIYGSEKPQGRRQGGGVGRQRNQRGRSRSARLLNGSLRPKTIVVVVRYTNSELAALGNPLQISTVHYTARCT